MRSWGTGPRTALLVHGYSDDSETWWRVGPAVAELGFTVLAPDLRGHGRSPRGRGYRFEDFAQDLVDTLDLPVHVAVGHSLGAVVLGLAATRLRPKRTVFVDPPWLRPPDEIELGAQLAARPDELPAEAAAWPAAEIAVDLASNARLDPQVGVALAQALGTVEGLTPPPAPEPGAVVLVPELDPALPLTAHPLLDALGYRVLTQPGVGHVMHRDDFDGFMDLLRPELLNGVIAA